MAHRRDAATNDAPVSPALKEAHNQLLLLRLNLRRLDVILDIKTDTRENS